MILCQITCKYFQRRRVSHCWTFSSALGLYETSWSMSDSEWCLSIMFEYTSLTWISQSRCHERPRNWYSLAGDRAYHWKRSFDVELWPHYTRCLKGRVWSTLSSKCPLRVTLRTKASPLVVAICSCLSYFTSFRYLDGKWKVCFDHLSSLSRGLTLISVVDIWGILSLTEVWVYIVRFLNYLISF